MDDIEVVVKIDKSTYYRFIDGFADEDDSVLIEHLFKNGTPLPKGHGNLCDEKQVVASLVWGGFLKDDVKCGDITKILDRATIIKTDKDKESE